MLSQTQKLQLRRKAHALHAVVILGQHGLTQAVHASIEEALDTHELIKIRINAEDRQARKAFSNEILEQHQAQLIQTIGHVIVIYRKAVKKD